MSDISIHTNTEPSIITCSAPDNTEMLKITKEGFYVRGVKVQSEDEPTLVYDAFKEFLQLHNLIK